MIRDLVARLGGAHPSDLALQRFAGGECAPDERARVAGHLASCARCRSAVTFARDLAAAARGLGPAGSPPPPDGLIERVLAERAAGRQVAVLMVDGKPVRAVPVRRFGAGLVAAALLVVVGAAAAALAALRGSSTARDAAAVVPPAPADVAADSAPTLGGVLTSIVLPSLAHAAELPPEPIPRLAGMDGRRLRPGRWAYEVTARVRNGRTHQELQRGRHVIDLAAAEVNGTPAWRVATWWEAWPGAFSETTYFERRSLRPLRRTAVAVGPSRYLVMQWFVGDSLQGSMTGRGHTQGLARLLPPADGPYLAGESVAAVLLQTVELRRGWRGRARLVGWGAVDADVTYPITLRVDGAERVRLPGGGECDCWRVLTSAGSSINARPARLDRALWVRKSDGVVVLARDSQTRQPGMVEEAVLVEERR